LHSKNKKEPIIRNEKGIQKLEGKKGNKILFIFITKEGEIQKIQGDCTNI